MKKLIFIFFLMTGLLTFPRYVERCRIIGFYTCQSLASGKEFTFNNVDFLRTIWGHIIRIEFYGSGYDDLTATDYEIN